MDLFLQIQIRQTINAPWPYNGLLIFNVKYNGSFVNIMCECNVEIKLWQNDSFVLICVCEWCDQLSKVNHIG